jgi:hypothetical protein
VLEKYNSTFLFNSPLFVGYFIFKILDMQKLCIIFWKTNEKEDCMLFTKDLLDGFYGYGMEDCEQSNDKEGNTIIEIDVPGFNKTNLEIELEDDYLSIKGSTEKRNFNRKFKLYNTDKVKAKVLDGVLTLKLIPLKKNVNRIEIE